jgi:hypothetical protein
MQWLVEGQRIEGAYSCARSLPLWQMSTIFLSLSRLEDPVSLVFPVRAHTGLRLFSSGMLSSMINSIQPSGPGPSPPLDQLLILQPVPCAACLLLKITRRRLNWRSPAS